MVRPSLGSAAAITFRFRRRRKPSWVSNCWLLASCPSCHGFLLPTPVVSDGRNRMYSSANGEIRHVCVLQKMENSIHQSAIVQRVAEELDLPVLSKSDLMDGGFTHAISVEDYTEGILPEEERYALAIQPLPAKPSDSRRSSRPNPIKPFWIDLCPGQRQSQPDLLLRAVAPQRVDGGAVVYDLTAGWGQDSLLLALGGASRVVMVERDPIVARLLADALRRLNCLAQEESSSRRTRDLSAILSLRVGDARRILLEPPLCPPDILYLDPMFPPRTKSAAVKKGMQILHGLLSDETDPPALHGTNAQRHRNEEEAELLQLAHQMARVKVVVKRPIHAPVLGRDGTNLTPSHVVKGSINRWDVYVKT